MKLAAAITALVVLAFPTTALAGGWATVEVAAPPAGIGPGETWRATFVVKQHGLTPLDDARPSLLIDNGRGETRQFFAEHAGHPGTYVADVTFPSKGTWKARVFDGWTDATPHRMAPIEVPTVGVAAVPSAAREPVRVPQVPPVEAAPAGFPVAKAAAIAFMGVVWLGLWIAVSGASLRVPVAMRARRPA
jgi:hypothetical protein